MAVKGVGRPKALGTSAASTAAKLAVVAAAISLVGPQRAAGRELRGYVVTEDRVPLSGATVCIVSVRPAAGQDAASPGCAPDCGKHAVTNERGRFVLGGLATGSFELLIMANGYHSENMVVDPDAPASVAEIMLTARPLGSRIVLRQIRGRVLLPNGEPATDAIVTVKASWPPVLTGRHYYADPEGRFTIYGDRQLQRVDVTVSAAGALGDNVFSLYPGGLEHSLQLIAGATVTGRVLLKAKPAEGIVVVATLTDRLRAAAARRPAVPVTLEQVTDSEGRFTFTQLARDKDLRISTKMRSLVKANLAGIPRDVQVPSGEAPLEVGELNLHPAQRLRGRLVTLGGEAVPESTWAVIERRGTPADWQEVPVDAQGQFEFAAVPRETVVLSFHSAGAMHLKEYHLASQNYSLDFAGKCTLCGRVDEDLELLVLLEPGQSRPYSPGSLPLFYNRGLRDHKFDAQQRIELAPLCGLRPEAIEYLKERNR